MSLEGLPLDAARLVDRLCDAYEASCRAASPVPIPDLLQQAPETLRPVLFRELLRVALDHQTRAGQPLTPTEARARFGHLGGWAVAVIDELFPPALVLTVEAGPPGDRGRSFRFTEHAALVVGRDPERCGFPLPTDLYFSRTHFMIEVNPPYCRLQDLNSKNGTLVNGTKVEKADLRDGDTIGGGTMKMRVRLEGSGWNLGPPATLTLGGVTASPPTIDPGADAVGWATVSPGPVGPRVPDYRIEAELGEGGMGRVYRAVREVDGTPVALKTIQPVVAGPALKEAKARFLREIEVLRQLDHPGIVKFQASGEAEGQLWFAMEYVPGRDGSAVVKAEGRLEVGRAVRWTLALVEALGYAHGLGFVHRDVKPHNLLVAQGSEGEVVKLADFGLARAYQSSALCGLTVTGQAKGTPAFMPPEQAIDFRSAKPAADQYSAAATLYYLLTGEFVFGRCGDIGEMIRRLLNETATPLDRVRPGLPVGLTAAVMRALARRPEDRFTDVRAFGQALRPFA